jgi:hypothetical protein
MYIYSSMYILLFNMNKILISDFIYAYCSYEHFYVLYCRFFELDGDKDSRISPEDLLKYNDRALSEMIVDRYVYTVYFTTSLLYILYSII